MIRFQARRSPRGPGSTGPLHGLPDPSDYTLSLYDVLMAGFAKILTNQEVRGRGIAVPYRRFLGESLCCYA